MAYTLPVCAAQHKVYVEPSKPTSRGDMLSTQAYTPTKLEKGATKDWTEKELESGSPEVQTLKGKNDRRIAWFGIVRDIKEDKQKKQTRVLVEMKYFDGMTDLHLQIVSLSGAGDFRVLIPGVGHKLKNLSLVRIYGKVTGEAEGVPLVSADYVRSWDWGLFAFMPYGRDNSNPKWANLRKVRVDDMRVYSSRPNRQYYEDRLGKDEPETPPNAKAVAGRYYRGDGTGYNVTLVLKEDGTYSGVWTGCLGRYGDASGSWKLSDNRIVLTPKEESGMMKGHLKTLDVLKYNDGWIFVPPDDRTFYDKYGATPPYWCFKKTDRK